MDLRGPEFDPRKGRDLICDETKFKIRAQERGTPHMGCTTRYRVVQYEGG